MLAQAWSHVRFLLKSLSKLFLVEMYSLRSAILILLQPLKLKNDFSFGA